jgi:hypothetical protein
MECFTIMFAILLAMTFASISLVYIVLLLLLLFVHQKPHLCGNAKISNTDKDYLLEH